jgi:hypothetical protein
MSDSPETESHAGTSGAAAEVGRWLRVRGFGQYASLFGERGITMEDLPRLTEADLKELGIVKIVERANLLSAIAKLREPGSGTPQPDPVAPMAVAAASLPGMAKPIAIQPQFGGPVTPKFAPNATAATATGTATQAAVPARRRTMKERFGGRFLVISILVHLLFAVAATYYVVQTITAKRKLTFHGGPPSPNPSQRAIEHKVQMAKKQHSMSAPVPSKRVVSTGMSKVALPEMPSMPAMNPVASSKMVGMGGTGVGLSTGIMGAGNSGGGGGAVPFFGFRSNTGGALEGTFFDFRTNQAGKPTGIKENDDQAFGKIIKSFINSGWKPASTHYTSPHKLYANYFFFPPIPSTDSGKAFNAPGHGGGGWFTQYSGEFASTESGHFRFVGFGDNVCLVRVGGKLVLDACDHDDSGVKFEYSGNISLPGKDRTPVFLGSWFEMQGGDYKPIDVIVGDYGGIFCAGVFLQKQGAKFSQDRKGIPQLPLFTTRQFSDADKAALGKFLPPVCFTGPVFTAKASSATGGSTFDDFFKKK